jgi:hypothetical protein
MPSTPKSELRTRKQDRDRQARQDAKARKACVEAVWARTRMKDGWTADSEYSQCEQCGDIVWRDGVLYFAGHVHEKRARSLGGDPHDPSQCELLCHACHFSGPSGAHRRSVRASR